MSAMCAVEVTGNASMIPMGLIPRIDTDECFNSRIISGWLKWR